MDPINMTIDLSPLYRDINLLEWIPTVGFIVAMALIIYIWER
jgi:hypothetical protein